VEEQHIEQQFLNMAKEQQQGHYIPYPCLCLCRVLSKEVKWPVAEPDELEDFGTVLARVQVLVQMQMQVEVLEQEEKPPPAVAEPD
jgi:hypothetical protein